MKHYCCFTSDYYLCSNFGTNSINLFTILDKKCSGWDSRNYCFQSSNVVLLKVNLSFFYSKAFYCQIIGFKNELSCSKSLICFSESQSQGQILPSMRAISGKMSQIVTKFGFSVKRSHNFVIVMIFLVLLRRFMVSFPWSMLLILIILVFYLRSFV